jgi:hypothetical protein
MNKILSLNKFSKNLLTPKILQQKNQNRHNIKMKNQIRTNSFQKLTIILMNRVLHQKKVKSSSITIKWKNREIILIWNNFTRKIYSSQTKRLKTFWQKKMLNYLILELLTMDGLINKKVDRNFWSTLMTILIFLTWEILIWISKSIGYTWLNGKTSATARPLGS